MSLTGLIWGSVKLLDFDAEQRPVEKICSSCHWPWI